MYSRFRPSHGTVVAYLALFAALGGTTYAATGGKFILGQSNTASSKSTLSAPIADKALTVTNNSTKAGAMALGLNVASGHPPFKVNSPTKVANLNADSLDGQDSTAFGRVRDFSRTIAAASAGPPIRDIVTFRGLTLSSQGNIDNGTLDCPLYASAADPGQFDDSRIYTDSGTGPTPLSNGASTPINHFFVGNAIGSGSRSVGELIFRDAATGRVLTVNFSVYLIKAADINNQGCTWQGTVTAAG
jgi:hypothetical protein